MRKIFFVVLVLSIFSSVACGPNDIYKHRGQKVLASVLSKRIEEVIHTNVSKPWLHTTLIHKNLTVSFVATDAENTPAPLTQDSVLDFIDHLGEGTPSNYYTVEITVSDEEYDQFNVGDKMEVYYIKADPTKVRTLDQVEGAMVRWK